MKIVFVSTSYYPHVGGVEKHVAELSRVLVERGHNVTVLTPMSGDVATREERIANVSIRRFHARPFIKAWLSLWRFRRVIRDADVLHLHDYSTYVWLLPYLMDYRKRFFITFHGWEGHLPPKPLTVRLRRFIERQSAGSIAIGKFIERWYGQHPTIILYGGHRPQEIRTRTLPNSGRRFLYVGRFANDTNVLDVLLFFSRVHAHDQTATLTMLGDGPVRDELQREILARNLPVTLHGWADDLEPFLSTAHVVVTNGYLGMIEALAAGAIVCTLYRNELKRDYVLHSPFAEMTIHAGTPDELFEAYRIATDQVEAQRLQQKNIESFLATHTWDNVTDAYMQLWNRKN